MTALALTGYLLFDAAGAHARSAGGPGGSIPGDIARAARSLKASVDASARMRELGTETPIVISFDASVPPDLRATLQDALRYLYAVRGRSATRLHRRIFGGQVDGRLYLMWLQQRVRSIQVGTCFPGPAAACYNPFTKSVTVTSPRMDRWTTIGILLHEARHADASMHELCGYGEARRPAWDRLGRHDGERYLAAACDRDPLGAYGTGAVALYNIAAFCEGCGDADRAFLRHQGMLQSRGVNDEDARLALNEDLFDLLGD